MKKAGDLLSVIIDDKMLGKAKGYSRLFSAWEQLTKKYGIAAAASHSRVLDIKRGVLLVDADHTGWIQILQTKELALLSDLQKTFPELDLTGIAFRLSKAAPGSQDGGDARHSPGSAPESPCDSPGGQAGAGDGTGEAAQGTSPDEAPGGNGPDSPLPGIEKIKNTALKEKLKSLEESISARGGASSRSGAAGKIKAKRKNVP